MNKNFLTIVLVSFCVFLTFYSSRVDANKTMPVNPVELNKNTKNLNKYLRQKKREQELVRKIKEIVKFIIPLILIVFTWMILNAKQTHEQKIYRLMAWYSLFSFTFIFYDLGLYPLPLLFIPAVIALWFQKHLPKIEVVFCSTVYFILLASMWAFILILGALASGSQGAGH